MAFKNKKLKILIGEPDQYSPKAITTLRKLGTVFDRQLSKKYFFRLLPEIDILVVRLGIRVDKRILDVAKNLKAVAVNTTGLNHIDLTEAEKRGIAVISLRGQTSFLEKIHATPELTFGLILALIRKIPWAFESVKKGQWDRNKFAGRELNRKILGLLGLGRVGKIVARYGKAFGMTLIACDPQVSAQTMKRYNVRKVNQTDLFKQADILSLHVLYSPKVDKMIKERHLRLLKPSALFINTARGELVDERALLKALRNKWIAGAALDVLGDESPDGEHLKNNPLLKYARRHENLLIVPHLGGAALEAWQMTEEYLASLVYKHFKDGSKR